MAKHFADDVDIPIPCTNCNKKITKKVKELNRNPNIKCPSCGQEITINMKDFNKSIKEVEKSIKDFGSKLK